MNIPDLDVFMLLTNDSFGSFDFDIVSVQQTWLHWQYYEYYLIYIVCSLFESFVYADAGRMRGGEGHFYCSGIRTRENRTEDRGFESRPGLF